jgi:hypothetical protein
MGTGKLGCLFPYVKIGLVKLHPGEAYFDAVAGSQ